MCVAIIEFEYYYNVLVINFSPKSYRKKSKPADGLNWVVTSVSPIVRKLVLLSLLPATVIRRVSPSLQHGVKQLEPPANRLSCCSHSKNSPQYCWSNSWFVMASLRSSMTKLNRKSITMRWICRHPLKRSILVTSLLALLFCECFQWQAGNVLINTSENN